MWLWKLFDLQFLYICCLTRFHTHPSPFSKRLKVSLWILQENFFSWFLTLWTAKRSNHSILKEIRKDWSWSWNSNTLATWCEELTHLKRPWCWERLRAGEGVDRGWDGRMVSPTQWTRVWVNSKSWWWTGGLACWSRWGHKESDMTEQMDWTELFYTVMQIQADSTSSNSYLSTSWAGPLALILKVIPSRKPEIPHVSFS